MTAPRRAVTVTELRRLKAQGERIFREMDLVQREEFEAVKEMAAKARDENERLARRVAELEAELARLRQ